jgi:hypothetical protein
VTATQVTLGETTAQEVRVPSDEEAAEPTAVVAAGLVDTGSDAVGLPGGRAGTEEPRMAMTADGSPRLPPPTRVTT